MSEREAYAALERWRASRSFVGYGELLPEDVDQAFLHGFEAGVESVQNPDEAR